MAMGTNFKFLKKINKNLYEIITEAEALYRDEYFEQCMTQTRRFGEQICKNLLEQNNRQTGSFDEMLATLKDQSHGHVQEKEFIDDLYFLKKNGNQSAHSAAVKKDAITALECLKRAFEAAINYSVYSQGASVNILKLNYDVDLLITKKKTHTSLKERYEEAKTKQKVQQEKITKTPAAPEKTKFTIFWKLIFFFSIISISLIIILMILIVTGKSG